MGPYTLIAIVASFCGTSFMQNGLKQRCPEARSFRWGFYNGLLAIFGGAGWSLVCFVASVLLAFRGNVSGTMEAFLLSVYFAIFACSGYFVVKRQRWAWVAMTLLSLNPIIWLVNGEYGQNRWDEFH